MELAENTQTWKQFNRPWYFRMLVGIGNYFQNVGLLIWSVVKVAPFKVWAFICSIGFGFQGLWLRFKNGDWRTRVSYLIMGFGCFSRSPKQVVKGLLWLAVEVVFIVYMASFGGEYLWNMGGLGDTPDRPAKYGIIPGDDSRKILLFAIMTIFVLIFFAYMWVKNTKIAYETQKRVQAGKPLSGIKQQINYALNDGYHITILVLPLFGIILISILPLIMNMLMAFTNFDGDHRPPAQLIEWDGLKAFEKVFKLEFGSVIWSVLGWTLIWAFFATFTNFFFGMFLAMMINKKSIKLKAIWRIGFIIVIAVPDFVSLMLMSQFFLQTDTPALTGVFNTILQRMFGDSQINVGWFSSRANDALLPRVMVIVVNMWRGMPFTMLATTGILMNIPEELYESSRIDGAGPVRRFISITFPYIMFVMGPQLITTFTGNINNFNVIFFLTGGGPTPLGEVLVGKTDLLVTWLYNLTLNRQHPIYNVGSVIGFFSFVISSFFALIVFNSSKSIKQEDTFK